MDPHLRWRPPTSTQTPSPEALAESIVVPAEPIAALSFVLGDLAAGEPISSPREEPTEQDLASLLNVSRPWVVTLLEAGENPFAEGRHDESFAASRRSAVQTARPRSPITVVRELTADSEALGLYL